jgi:hypothetical protein
MVLFKEGRSLRTLEDDNAENINNYYEEREIGEQITKEKGIEIKFLSKIFHKYLLRMRSVEMQLEKTSNKIEQIVRFFRNGDRKLLKQHLTEMKLGFFGYDLTKMKSVRRYLPLLWIKETTVIIIHKKTQFSTNEHYYHFII